MEGGDKQRAERGYETDAEEDDLAVSGKPLRMVRVPAHVVSDMAAAEEAAADTKVVDAEPSIEDPSPDQLRAAAAAAASAAAAADGTAPAHACVNPIPTLLKVKSVNSNPDPNPLTLTLTS